MFLFGINLSLAASAAAAARIRQDNEKKTPNFAIREILYVNNPNFSNFIFLKNDWETIRFLTSDGSYGGEYKFPSKVINFI